MTKQSLNERFNNNCLKFVKSVLCKIIENQFSEILISQNFLSDYNHVRIKDSTTFKVPDNLSANFGGNGCGLAGITIQYEYDLKTGKVLDLNITAASRNDQRDAGETSESICENDLILRDMGYFTTSVLSKIKEKKAFFLFRLPATVNVYDEKGVEIDFKKLHAYMLKNRIDKIDKHVFIGQDRLPVRLAIGLVPPSVYQERMRRKEKEEKKKGRKSKERTLVMLNFNLFVTNADSEKLPSEKIMPLYRFRWQVELMFKNWKSVFSIHTLQKMKEERYLTMLYFRLIVIIINMQIINRAQSIISKREERILSYQKAFVTMKNKCTEILEVLRSGFKKAMKIMESIYIILSKNHWREKRKKRENFIENINLFIC